MTERVRLGGRTDEDVACTAQAVRVDDRGDVPAVEHAPLMVLDLWHGSRGPRSWTRRWNATLRAAAEAAVAGFARLQALLPEQVVAVGAGGRDVESGRAGHAEAREPSSVNQQPLPDQWLGNQRHRVLPNAHGLLSFGSSQRSRTGISCMTECVALPGRAART